MQAQAQASPPTWAQVVGSFKLKPSTQSTPKASPNNATRANTTPSAASTPKSPSAEEQDPKNTRVFVKGLYGESAHLHVVYRTFRLSGKIRAISINTKRGVALVEYFEKESAVNAFHVCTSVMTENMHPMNIKVSWGKHIDKEPPVKNPPPSLQEQENRIKLVHQKKVDKREALRDLTNHPSDAQLQDEDVKRTPKARSTPKWPITKSPEIIKLLGGERFPLRMTDRWWTDGAEKPKRIDEILDDCIIRQHARIALSPANMGFSIRLPVDLQHAKDEGSDSDEDKELRIGKHFTKWLLPLSAPVLVTEANYQSATDSSVSSASSSPNSSITLYSPSSIASSGYSPSAFTLTPRTPKHSSQSSLESIFQTSPMSKAYSSPSDSSTVFGSPEATCTPTLSPVRAITFSSSDFTHLSDQSRDVSHTGPELMWFTPATTHSNSASFSIASRSPSSPSRPIGYLPPKDAQSLGFIFSSIPPWPLGSAPNQADSSFSLLPPGLDQPPHH